ncbi:astacin-like metalloendopeptidase [Clinocottus analis]|uniref:astacin-like metalloendopeptidase n=1 Tax=Clinocottus analis TaxID=304258 RepID=UPI0035C0B6F8
MLQLVLPALLLLEASRLGACSPLRAAESPQDEVMEVMDEPKYHDFDPETVEELLSQDHAVMEGDLLQLSDRNAVGVAWPTHVIPYMIDPNLAARRGDVLAALAMLSKHTCLTFPKRTDEADYLHFQTSEGCASFVGFVGGGQSLFIGPTCVMGNIVHEILHAVGFHHEHTRTDRGPYIKVLTENILPGKERNFEQIAGTTFDLSYDISSILHYGSNFFSANGQPTIVASVAAADMGQRVRLTATDMRRVALLYHCGTSV